MANKRTNANDETQEIVAAKKPKGQLATPQRRLNMSTGHKIVSEINADGDGGMPASQSSSAKFKRFFNNLLTVEDLARMAMDESEESEEDRTGLGQGQEQGQGPSLSGQRNEPQPQLIGDHSKPCALPCLLTGIRYSDIKTISVDTLARLIRGEFIEQLGTGGSYQIIDCRYPYEFHGGHIRGARNIFTLFQVKQSFPIPKPKEEPEGGRRIYVFHCEFSSRRGPSLLRFLHNRDRLRHLADYPTLDYPELYLLHKGYKQFYHKHRDLCEPRDYVPMTSPGYEAELRLYQTIDQPQRGDGQVATLPKPSSTLFSRHFSTRGDAKKDESRSK